MLKHGPEKPNYFGEMDRHNEFKLILNSKEYLIPSIFNQLPKISKFITDALIFNVDHRYEVQSKVSEEVFESFIKYLIEEEEPKIEINNYHEYLELKEEFNIMKEIITKKEKEWSQDLEYIKGLHLNSKEERSFYETRISEHLDYYLQKYQENIMKEPIEILYNIFFNLKRELKDHNYAYELIKISYEQTHNSNLFILLPSLDGNKLCKENLHESIFKREERKGFLTNEIEKINTLQSIIEQQKSTIENITKSITTIEQQHSKEINELKMIIQEQKSTNEQSLNEIQNNHSNEIQTIQQQHSKEIKELKNIINELKSTINKSINEIRANQQQHSNEIEKNRKIITEQNNEISKKREQAKNEIKKEMKKEISNLKDMIQNQKEKIKSNQNQQDKTNETIKQTIENKITEFKTKQEKEYEKIQTEINQSKTFLFSKICESSNKSISIEPSLTKNGILNELKTRSTNIFDPPFIASQSSNDIYNLIDPNTKDKFSTNNDGHFFIKFELENQIMINGIKIISATDYFPKSFDIEINDEIVKSIKEANELNGVYKEMTINFPPKNGKIIRFIQTGPNWSHDNNYLNIKQIELLSSENQYSKGIFSTLIEKSKNKDPHNCSVHISSTVFDFNSFYLINAKLNIWTFDEDNPWFQIELTKGFGIITGFRLKRDYQKKIKSFKIIGSNDIKKPIEIWEQLIEIKEETEDEHRVTDIYSFDHPSSPIRFIRIIQIEPNWTKHKFLKFFHFDIFGSYF